MKAENILKNIEIEIEKAKNAEKTANNAKTQLDSLNIDENNKIKIKKLVEETNKYVINAIQILEEKSYINLYTTNYNILVENLNKLTYETSINEDNDIIKNITDNINFTLKYLNEHYDILINTKINFKYKEHFKKKQDMIHLIKSYITDIKNLREYYEYLFKLLKNINENISYNLSEEENKIIFDTNMIDYTIFYEFINEIRELITKINDRIKINKIIEEYKTKITKLKTEAENAEAEAKKAEKDAINAKTEAEAAAIKAENAKTADEANAAAKEAEAAAGRAEAAAINAENAEIMVKNAEAEAEADAEAIKAKVINQEVIDKEIRKLYDFNLKEIIITVKNNANNANEAKIKANIAKDSAANKIKIKTEADDKARKETLIIDKNKKIFDELKTYLKHENKESLNIIKDIILNLNELKIFYVNNIKSIKNDPANTFFSKLNNNEYKKIDSKDKDVFIITCKNILKLLYKSSNFNTNHTEKSLFPELLHVNKNNIKSLYETRGIQELLFDLFNKINI